LNLVVEYLLAIILSTAIRVGKKRSRSANDGEADCGADGLVGGRGESASGA